MVFENLEADLKIVWRNVMSTKDYINEVLASRTRLDEGGRMCNNIWSTMLIAGDEGLVA